MVTVISINRPDPFLFWTVALKNLIAAIVFGLVAFYTINPAQKQVVHPNIFVTTVPGNVVDSVLPVTFLKHK